MIPDFETWLKYPNGPPFPIGTKVLISPKNLLHPRCYGYVRGYNREGRAIVEVPHVNQRIPEAIKLEHLSLWKDPYA